MSIKLGLLFALLIGAFSVSCWAGHIPDNGDHQRSIVQFDFEGHQVRVPMYEEDSVITSEKRRSFEVETLGAMMDIADNLVKDLTINKRNMVAASGSAIPKILSLAIKKQGEFRKMTGEDAKPHVKDGYTRDMSKLMLTILSFKRSNKDEADKLTDEQVYEKAHIILGASKMMPSESPSGLYVDWANLEIDGQRIDKYSEPIIEWFNQSAGRRLCITGAKKIANLLGNFASN